MRHANGDALLLKEIPKTNKSCLSNKSKENGFNCVDSKQQQIKFIYVVKMKTTTNQTAFSCWQWQLIQI